MASILTAILVGGSTEPAAATTGPPLAGAFADPSTTPTTGGSNYVTVATTTTTTGYCGYSSGDPEEKFWVPYIIHGSGNTLALTDECIDGDLLPTSRGAWADQSQGVWAPSIVRYSGQYFLYYTATKAGTTSQQYPNGLKCIGIATSTTGSIVGPYSPSASPVVCHSSSGRWALDPQPLLAGGNLYLTWRDDSYTTSTYGSALVLQQMNTSGFPTGTVRTLLESPDLSWDDFTSGGVNRGIIENPSMLQISNGRYYLFFSGDAWSTPRYATGVADCGTTVLAGSPGKCTQLGSTSRPYFGYSGSADNPLYTLPGDHEGPGGMMLFRTHGGAARVIWAYLDSGPFCTCRPALAEVVSFNGSTWSIP